MVDGEKSERCNLFAQWNHEIMKIKHFLDYSRLVFFFLVSSSTNMAWVHGCVRPVDQAAICRGILRLKLSGNLKCNVYLFVTIFVGVFWLWKWKLQFTTNMLGSFHSCGVAELMSRTFYHSLKTYSVANDCLTTRAKKAWKGRGWRQFGKSRHIPSFGLRC